MPQHRLLSVGQCGADHASLSHYFRTNFDAEVVSADTSSEALDLLKHNADGYDLVLVNRVGDRDGRPGVDLIRALKDDPGLADIPVMLVSNYETAQQEAANAGALPGFGKSELGAPEVKQRLDQVLGA